MDKFGFDTFLVAAPVGALFCVGSALIYGKHDSYSKVTPTIIRKDTEESESENTLEIELSVIPDHCNSSTRSMDNPTTVDTSDREPQQPFMLFKSMMATSIGIGYLVSAFTLKMGTTVVENLIFLFFESLGASNALCGLTVAVTVVFEIPFFYYAPMFLERFGPETLQEVACMAYIVRVVGYTLIPERHVFWVLFLEPLHGVTYACSKTSSVEFARRLAPEGYEASTQGILSLFLGIGSFCGLGLGAFLNGVVLYRVDAAVVTVGLVFFIIIRRMFTSVYDNL